jgi:hypothetical protein
LVTGNPVRRHSPKDRGAFIAGAFGSLTPLIILIVLKTVADLGLHLLLDFGDRTKQIAGAPSVASV